MVMKHLLSPRYCFGAKCSARNKTLGILAFQAHTTQCQKKLYTNAVTFSKIQAMAEANINHQHPSCQSTDVKTSLKDIRLYIVLLEIRFETEISQEK